MIFNDVSCSTQLFGWYVSCSSRSPITVIELEGHFAPPACSLRTRPLTSRLLLAHSLTRPLLYSLPTASSHHRATSTHHHHHNQLVAQSDDLTVLTSPHSSRDTHAIVATSDDETLPHQHNATEDGTLRITNAHPRVTEFFNRRNYLPWAPDLLAKGYMAPRGSLSPKRVVFDVDGFIIRLLFVLFPPMCCVVKNGCLHSP
ncbi:hypothetical protein B0T19DRAFT_65333 [Cercophora scortea]|uniref:Uncharacterized protein n=1 Tax=Cercophora scortea TaxID=314031 RepID=A0AAE0J5G2_9PEZI|nr:hypothetical protein B0T19DRAFT_65333 [Cercophora scortea]